MKKIISYCLFLPQGMVKNRRHWDNLWNDAKRYWYNIPALCVTDAAFYPDYVKRFYVTQDVMNHELGEFFHKIQNVENFEVQVVSDKYENRQLIVQRFQPFWEDWDIVLPRDVDSIVTNGEWQCSKVFEESPEAHVYSSRSHRQHSIMMGGLSGFRPKLIQDKIGNNLEEFVETYSLGEDHRWDLDQAILNRAFANDKDFASNRYYDMRIHRAPGRPKFDCKKYVPIKEIQSHQSSPEMKNLIRVVEEYTGGRWAGMPVNLRGVGTKTLLDHNPEIKNVIYSSPKLLEFYHIPFWASEDVWSSDSPLSVMDSVKKYTSSRLPSSWFIPRIYRNPNSHKGDTSRELLSMWDEAGYCKLIDFKSSLSWWGSPEEEVLLYEFNHEKRARIPGNSGKSIKLGLFANLIPSNWGVRWIFWARHPRALEKRIEEGLLTYEKRDISSIFIGNIGTPEQRSRRRKQDWSQCTEIFSLLNGWSYKYTQEEYLNMMARSKFGLCLAGYGGKCNREPECMGLGTVPIVAPEVDMNYYDSPEEGVHYFRVNSPDQVKEITEGLGETEWKRMSDNCIDWWNRNCSRKGSFETTQRIIEENYPN
tara:strand:- start:5152 stop:6921 length:1770 start_codon:yes stop_codon:yes gene_type:complete